MTVTAHYAEQISVIVYWLECMKKEIPIATPRLQHLINALVDLREDLK